VAAPKSLLEGDIDMLDIKTIAATLAVLGSGASLVGCAHQAAPATAKDAQHGDAAQGAVAACGAGSCGAVPKAAGGEASCGSKATPAEGQTPPTGGEASCGGHKQGT
jgi:hypothetical protein